MSCIRVAHVPVPRRPTPAGAEDTSSRDSLVIVIRCAQRRPERQPRLHLTMLSTRSLHSCAQRRPESTPATRYRWSDRSRHPMPLNEGRSVNPGYTGCQGATLPASTSAQRRPERQPRLHGQANLWHDPFHPAQRRPERQPRLHLMLSLASPTSVSAQRRPERQPRLHTLWTPMSSRALSTLNEGRSVNPGYTKTYDEAFADYARAQRRPERQPRLHVPVTVQTYPRLSDAQRRPERQPRLHSIFWCLDHLGISSAQRRPERQPRLHVPVTVQTYPRLSDAQRRPERQPRLHSIFWCLDHLGISSAQRRPERQPRLHLRGHARHRDRHRRSTKAGASTPATPGTPIRELDNLTRSTKAGASTPATRCRHRRP